MAEQWGIKMLTPDQVLARWQANPDVLLLDVRTPEEWKMHHIPGATLIPMHTLMNRLSDLDPGRETIVICEHGMRSQAVADYLVRQARFENVANMVGGMSEWMGPVQEGK